MLSLFRVSTNKKVLIVEDNKDCRELQAVFIRRLGYEVIEADNGAAAIEEALAGQPDLILMDLSMPKMNGEDAIVQLKNLPSTREIPVIICTAYDPGSRVNRAIVAGAVEVLHKPFNFSDLENLLRKHIRRDQKSGAEGGQNSPSNPMQNRNFLFNRGNLLNLPEKKRRTQWALAAEEMKNCVWLKPELVVQIEYTEWTPDDHLRHARLSGFARIRDRETLCVSRPES